MYEGSKRFRGFSGLGRTRVNASARAHTLSFFVFNNKKTRHADRRFVRTSGGPESIRIIRRIPVNPLSSMPELREHELHRQIGDIPKLNVGGGPVSNRV